MRTSKLLVSFLGVVSLGVMACSSNNSGGDGDVGPDPNGSITPPSGDNPADAGVTVVPPGCDSTKTPSQDACVVIEALGLFVAPPAADAGTDGGASLSDGTRARPYTKIQDAIDAAKAQNKRVYACAGTFAEQITLADGVSMFGNLDCASWSVVPAHASVQAPASPVVVANNITTPTRIEAFDFIAPDGSASAPTSIALVATGSSALTIAQSTLHAGKGENGADGVAPVQLTNGSIAAANGVKQYLVSASLPICASQPESVNTCIGAPGFSGGNGGAGGWGGHWVVRNPNPGAALASVVEWQLPAASACAPGRPCVCSNQDGNAATATTAQGGHENPISSGIVDGSSGNAGLAGTDGAIGVAAITVEGGLHFVVGDGAAGTNGAPGQGGGGGWGFPASVNNTWTDGAQVIGNAGASGGAGGCPGLAGTAGGGGGASIAILSSDSPIVFDTCNLQSSDAGNGGRGTVGSNASGGLAAGIDYASLAGTAGGSGGAGGASGWSGSGAGGWSVAIVAHGAAPTMTGSAATFGKAGLGVDVIAGNGKTIPATAAGIAGATKSF